MTRKARNALAISVMRLEQLEPRCLLSSTPGWSEISVPVPSGVGTMMLLPDGSVMAQQGGLTNAWYRLTPDASGNYATGTWTQAASMNYSRLYFTSDILSTDKLLVVGGEYSNAIVGGNTDGDLTGTAEMYDMSTNSWTNLAAVPTTVNGTTVTGIWGWGKSDSGAPFGDDPSMVLPDGKILCGFIFDSRTLIYDPVANTWSLGPSKLYGDQSDEESWVKLPNGNVLSYDIYTSTPSAQMFVPDPNPAVDGTEGKWVDAGTPPVALASSYHELGPGSLLPDGDVFYEGATGHTALYDYRTNTWAKGPDILLNNAGGLMVADDAPAAVLPNGNVLFTADSESVAGYQPPTAIFDYDPVANTITHVADLPDMILSGEPAFIDRMLVLPNGQVLFSAGDSFGNTTPLFLYTPSGGPDASWRPSIGGIVSNGGGSFTLSGVQLNGMSEGAYYGDDAEMAENFPIVQFRSLSGHVYYATSSNWSSQGVQTGSSTVTVDAQLPAGTPAGTYLVTVSAAGISSIPRLFHVGTTDVPPAGTQPEPLGTPIGQGTTAAPGPGIGLAPVDVPQDDDAGLTTHAIQLSGPWPTGRQQHFNQHPNPQGYATAMSNRAIAATDAVFRFRLLDK